MARADFLTHTPIAHRGLHNGHDAPENSLKAFQRAVDGKFLIELDIHIIKSGEVVVFHDDNLRRICGIDKDLKDCTFTEIRELNLKHTHERIPLLSEALAVINGKVPILIELKTDQKAGKLEAAALDILKRYKGKYAIQSFNPLSLRWLRKNAPHIVRGQLACDFSKAKKGPIFCKRALKNLRFYPIAQPDFISYDFHALPNARVAKLRAQGTPVLGWTVKKVSESQEALKYCDNLICEEIL